MKTTNKITVNKEFQPRQVLLTFETEEELESLYRAFSGLCRMDISDEHSYNDRDFWISIIEDIYLCASNKRDETLTVKKWE